MKKSISRMSHASLAAIVLLASAAHATEKTAALPTLRIDPARVAVAGLSAGAYAATQAQIAYPEVFHGAALVAGGPYDCAQGNLATAVTVCMKGTPAPDAAALVKAAQSRAAKGEIGPLQKLAGAKVYVLHGRQDPVVAESVAHAAVEFYDSLKSTLPELANLTVTWDGARDFAHTFPTENAGTACDKVASPFIGRCGFDAAGAIFHALFGKPAHNVGTAAGELRRFEQNAFQTDGTDAGLAAEGAVYVPSACLKNRRCGILVALHGCQQNIDSVGEAFINDAGFNRWADAYDVAVLYPQARAMPPLNPKGCWDWFGYTGPNYATREGAQLRWIVRALSAMQQGGH
ncbi:MAG: PHB depolymerase family esterase [Rudaea sp.]